MATAEEQEVAPSDVLQHVLVFDVTPDGEDVHVDVYGSEERICGSICFHFPDATERRRQLRTLFGWVRDEVPVTYVARDGHVSLVDERALLADLSEPEADSAAGSGSTFG